MKMRKTSYNQILEVNHFEPGLAQSPQSQWRDLRLTWGSEGKKVGWKLEGGWTWLGPPSKFQHISVPTRNLNLTLLLVITKFKGLEIFGEALGYLWIDQWIQRHWGRLRFRDFQISETPETTKLRSKTRLFGVPPRFAANQHGGWYEKFPFFKVEKRLQKV